MIEGVTDMPNNSGALTALLREFWGKDAKFLSGEFYIEPDVSAKTAPISQEAILDDIVSQAMEALTGAGAVRDVVLTAPTGSGKSLFYQLAGVLMYRERGAVTLVVSPLVALMHDQVAELHERGVSFATYLDSTLTYQERSARIRGIQAGEYGIVYLSPELLLSLSIGDLIGDTPLGLIAVDEAHLVTSWGRDFRVDYWFLGDYISSLRLSGARRFPVLCLTATAVRGGREDVIGELTESLGLNNPILYLGYARRDNITFDIRPHETGDKLALTIEHIARSVDAGEKTLCYFPFITQLEDVSRAICSESPALSKKVSLYNSRMDNAGKENSYLSFRSGETPAMLATKAFGMGVNIPDVNSIYHYAPTGTLSDYVQEIGRAARTLERGVAACDSLPGDMRYARTLWSMSGIRHYQLREMVAKLLALRELAAESDFLVSPDTFSYLFGQMECENKVKSGLMLLSGDISGRLGAGAMTVHLDDHGSAVYIVVPTPVEDVFIKRYGDCVFRVSDDIPRVSREAPGKSETITRKAGGVYRVKPIQLWERAFGGMSYPHFKKKLMAGELFTLGSERVAANIRLVIDYREGFSATADRLGELSGALQRTFSGLRRSHGGKEFPLSAFLTMFEEAYGRKSRREMGRMLLDVFSFDRGDMFDFPQEQWKFVEKRHGQHEETVYAMRTERFGMIENGLKRYLSQAAPNTEVADRFVSYLPIPKPGGRVSEYQLVAQLLELLHLATYDIGGGRAAPLRVSIPDVEAVRALTEQDGYRNALLSAIEDRHARAEKLMTAFMRAELPAEKRWELIEQYFLGNDEVVDRMVGLV